jgi:hypothetical protein
MKLGNFYPKWGQVLVEITENTTKGGIHLVSSEEILPQAKVIKVGPDCKCVIEGETILLEGFRSARTLIFEDYPTSLMLVPEFSILGGDNPPSNNNDS